MKSECWRAGENPASSGSPGISRSIVRGTRESGGGLCGAASCTSLGFLRHEEIGQMLAQFGGTLLADGHLPDAESGRISQFDDGNAARDSLHANLALA